MFFFKQKTAYEMRISDWSSDVCSSDLNRNAHLARLVGEIGADARARKMQHAGWQLFQQQVVTLERGGLGVPVPVGLESNRGDLAVARPAVGDVLGAARGAAVEQNHVGVAGVHLVERCPDAPMIMIVGAAGDRDPRDRKS